MEFHSRAWENRLARSLRTSSKRYLWSVRGERESQWNAHNHRAHIKVHAVIIIRLRFVVEVVFVVVVVLVIIVIVIVIVAEGMEVGVRMRVLAGRGGGTVEMFEERVVSLANALKLGRRVLVVGVLVRMRLERELNGSDV